MREIGKGVLGPLDGASVYQLDGWDHQVMRRDCFHGCRFSWRSLHAIEGLGLEHPVSDSDQ